MVTILVMSTNLPTPGLLKIKTYQSKVYDVIILDYDVSSKVLSLYSRCGHVTKVWQL